MNVRRMVLAAAALVAVASGVTPAHAESFYEPTITGTGSFTVISAPSSVIPGAQEDDTKIQVFPERLVHVLTDDIAVDFDQPGDYVRSTPLPATQPVIEAGRVVNSYFIHVDRLADNTAAPGNVYEATFVFDAPILGVIAKGETLVNTHGTLGSPQTQYPQSPGKGTMELGQGDWVKFDAPSTLTVHATNWNVADQVRVITQGTP